jgi:hypothetical protein
MISPMCCWAAPVAEWEYSTVYSKKISTKIKWNRDQPADFDSSQDQILG